jgi:hypothetical protein
MTAIANSTMDNVINEQYGFITSADILNLIEDYADMMVLIRCGCGRYTCRLDQVDTAIRIVEKNGDYVRDVSLIADNYERVKNGQSYIKTDRIIQR